MNNLKVYKLSTLVLFVFGVSFGSFGQSKSVEGFDVSGEDVVISVNTSHTNVTFETWNKDRVEVEAYVEGEGLSEEEKKEIFDSWNFEVLGNSSRVVITSFPGLHFGDNTLFPDLSSMKQLEFLGPMMKDMPIMATFEMPVLPEKLFKSINDIHFDYEAFKDNEEEYMEKWDAQMKEKFGKDFQIKMEKWGEEFSKEWDEKNGAKLSEEWQMQMETWGEKFGKEMEVWGQNLEKDMEKWAQQLEEDNKNDPNSLFTKKVITSPNGNKTIILKSKKTGKLKDVKATKNIIIRMPKNSKTEINVRHGEIKMADVMNVKATLNYSPFTANSIDGGATLINAAYAPVIVNNWKHGTLYVKFVDDCTISTVDQLNLRANSSDVLIGTLVNEATLVGSLGNFKIDEIADGFTSVNITLKNNDAYFKMPNTSFVFDFDGKRSTLKYPKALHLNSKKQGERVLVTGFNKLANSPKKIRLNALYSNVVMH